MENKSSVWVAPVGTPFPGMETDPGESWVYLGGWDIINGSGQEIMPSLDNNMEGARLYEALATLVKGYKDNNLNPAEFNCHWSFPTNLWKKVTDYLALQTYVIKAESQEQFLFGLPVVIDDQRDYCSLVIPYIKSEVTIKPKQ